MGIPYRMQIYLTIFLAVLVFGIAGLVLIEGFSPVDAIYFLIVTIATVGYGDLHPSTVAGKILVMIIILAGVGCFIGIAANSIEGILEEQERKARIRKLNMTIGVFFSEAGTELIRRFSRTDSILGTVREKLIPTTDWSDQDFSRASHEMAEYRYSLDSRKLDLPDLYTLLSDRKELLLALLQNPTMLEHETFSSLLQALFHLLEELDQRVKHGGFSGLPESDLHHLSGDINRVYRLLVLEWLLYMHHLKKMYPYLFSLSVRTNPFDEKASVVVRE